MRLTYLLVALMVAAGVGVSLFLVPRSKELALQTYRDRDYEQARDAYVARFAAGDRGADVIMPLVGLSVDAGDVGQAVAYLEEYVAREPDQVDSRELLGDLYKASERMGDYLHNLEEVVRLRPTYERVYELAAYYRFYGRFAQLEKALRKQIDVRPDDRDAVEELAALAAARGARDEALAVLVAFDDRDAGRKTTPALRSLLTALLVEKGDADQAVARADRWFAGGTPTPEIVDLTGMLAAIGRADLAYRLMKPYESRAASDEALALALADLETALGRLDDARLRLTAWAARGPVGERSLGRFIGLAANAGLSRLALDVAQGRDLRTVPDWALAGLTDTAFRNRDRAFLDRAAKELGDGFPAERPLLASEIALARDDKPAAQRWAAAALADPALSATDRLTAVRLLMRAGATERAAAAFDALPLSGALPDDALIELGGLFIDMGRAADGFRWFENRRRDRPSFAADLGWARLSARAGDPDAVTAWLETGPRVEGWVLQDVATAAAERGGTPGAARLALAAAERAYALSRTDQAATALAAAYLVNGRAGEALELVRPLLQWGGAPVEAVYVGALRALGMLEELASYWTARLANGVLSEQEADNVLFAMTADKSYKAALPYLKIRAETRGGDWLFAYADAARGVGGDAVDGLIALLDGAADDAAMTDAERERRLFLLIETSRTAAAATLARLTDCAPGRWWAMTAENLRRLNRNDALADMLERLIDRADVGRADREAMVFTLIDAGGAARALPAIARLADEIGGTWDAVYRENLVRLGRRDELRRYLIARVKRPDLSVEDRRALVFSLLEAGEKATAVEALTVLAAGQGPDGEDARQLYFLWGPRPEPKALDWLERRARQAPTAEAKGAWLVRLTELGGRDRAAALLGGGDDPPADPALLRAFVEVKAASRDDDGVARGVRAAARVEKAPETLRRYARLAEQSRRGDAAAAAWAALLTLRPDDGDALRQLGMTAYDADRYIDAERFLRRYVARRETDDYEACYFLGEALTLLKRPGEATPFYRTALARLRAAKPPPDQNQTVQRMQTEAGLLNRLNRIDEAIVVYEKLRRLRPDDKRIKADYVNMLIENRRLPEARNALAVR